jgi:hypothetical protein
MSLVIIPLCIGLVEYERYNGCRCLILLFSGLFVVFMRWFPYEAQAGLDLEIWSLWSTGIRALHHYNQLFLKFG